MDKTTMLERKYPSRRRELLRFLQDENGNIGQGLDDEYLTNCILMIVDYFNYHLPNMKIPSKAIPDVAYFKPSGLNEYTIEQFIYNRLRLNLVQFVFKDAPPKGVRPEAIGGYTPSTKTLTLYRDNFIKHIREKCQTINNANETTVTQAILVHELIHAISKTSAKETGFTYFDSSSVKHNISLNEGVTENLAMDVCELNDVFFTVKKDDFVVTANTTSSYKLEVGIANLLKVADGERFYIKFLVDAKRIAIKREDADLMSVVKRVTDLYRPTKDENIEREKVNDYQMLQYILIKDIFYNKLHKEILEPVKRGEQFDKKKFRALRREMYEIGKSIIPTIIDKSVSEEELDFTSSVDHIRDLIDKGKIASTQNVEMYAYLMEEMQDTERKYGIPPKR